MIDGIGVLIVACLGARLEFEMLQWLATISLQFDAEDAASCYAVSKKWISSGTFERLTRMLMPEAHAILAM